MALRGGGQIFRGTSSVLGLPSHRSDEEHAIEQKETNLTYSEDRLRTKNAVGLQVIGVLEREWVYASGTWAQIATQGMHEIAY